MCNPPAFQFGFKRAPVSRAGAPAPCASGRRASGTRASGGSRPCARRGTASRPPRRSCAPAQTSSATRRSADVRLSARVRPPIVPSSLAARCAQASAPISSKAVRPSGKWLCGDSAPSRAYRLLSSRVRSAYSAAPGQSSCAQLDHWEVRPRAAGKSLGADASVGTLGEEVAPLVAGERPAGDAARARIPCCWIDVPDDAPTRAEHAEHARAVGKERHRAAPARTPAAGRRSSVESRRSRGAACRRSRSRASDRRRRTPRP